MSKEKFITLKLKIDAKPLHVWNAFTEAKHIIYWNFANKEWHCPEAKADLKVNGKFDYRMEAKDGSFGFNLKGIYTKVDAYSSLHYTLEDNRKVEVTLEEDCGETIMTQRFQPESQNPIEVQQGGWQAILDNFKSYVETSL